MKVTFLSGRYVLVLSWKLIKLAPKNIYIWPTSLCMEVHFQLWISTHSISPLMAKIYQTTPLSRDPQIKGTSVCVWVCVCVCVCVTARMCDIMCGWMHMCFYKKSTSYFGLWLTTANTLPCLVLISHGPEKRRGKEFDRRRRGWVRRR